MKKFVHTIIIFILFVSCKKETKIELAKDEQEFQEKTLETFIQAKPGDTIVFPEGRFRFTKGLSITVDNVTVKGAGKDKTILSFDGQTQGSDGITVTGNKFTIQDLTIEDAKANCIKFNGVDGIIIRRVATRFTKGPKNHGGVYGFYPVTSKNILIEESYATGAGDAGFYIGQSMNIVLRNNLSEFNVIGISIENSSFVDIYNNTVRHNTGGILTFDLPDIPVQGGGNVRIFENDIYENNTDNFAPGEIIASTIPTGTGTMVMANKQVEIFKNRIWGNDTVNTAIVSYYMTNRPIKDKNYDPHPYAVYVFDNEYKDGGRNPRGVLVQALKLRIGTPFPDIVFDGVINEQKAVNGMYPDNLRICIENDSASFADIDGANLFRNVNRDIKSYECKLPRLAAVELKI